MSRLVKGRVVRVDAKVCHVETGDGVFLAAPRGALFDKLDAQTKNPVAVGDWVLVETGGRPMEGLVAIAPAQVLYSEVRGPLEPVLGKVSPVKRV